MAGPQCCENPPVLDSGFGAGTVEAFGGLNCYISGSSDSKLAIILSTDAFGYEAPKMRKVADKLADDGFYVLAPDFFHGDPYAPENVERPVPKWLEDHRPENSVEDAKSVVEALKSKGISKIGAVGFCWGAKAVVELAKNFDIQSAVLCHPSFVTVEDMEGVKIPMAILGAETDHRSPPEVVKQFEAALKAEPQVDCFVKVFNGVSHGWSLRYDDEDELTSKCAAEAHEDIVGWFSKCLK